MSHAYLQLAERIRGEMEELRRVVDRSLHSWSRAQQAADEQSVYLESVALNLHAFYTGIERLFELIARHVDGETASGQMWHRDLIRQMADEELEVRPAVISAETASQLDEFRRFRHLVRNAYSFNLEADKMTGVVDTLSPLWKQIHAELLAFADFLEALDNS